MSQSKTSLYFTDEHGMWTDKEWIRSSDSSTGCTAKGAQETANYYQMTVALVDESTGRALGIYKPEPLPPCGG